MTTSTVQRQRNLTLECCKLIAACFVVFIHVPFPGSTGEFVLCLSRFAVPMFFAISGWYCYQASRKTLFSRMCRVLVLEAIGIAILLLWSAVAAVYTGQPVLKAILPDLPEPGFVNLLLWLEDPFASHLWYLSASVFCYGVFLIFNCSRNKRPRIFLYCLGLFLLCANLAMDEFSGYTGCTVFFKLPRSGVFLGLPIFLMGLFLREHRDLLLSRFRTCHLFLLLFCSMGLTLGEWRVLGSHGLYVGLLPFLSALLLLTSRFPGVPPKAEQLAQLCGPVSTWVYLVHLTVRDVYLGFVQWRAELYLGSSEPWLRPWIILALSLAAALGIQAFSRVTAAFFKKT